MHFLVNSCSSSRDRIKEYGHHMEEINPQIIPCGVQGVQLLTHVVPEASGPMSVPQSEKSPFPGVTRTSWFEQPLFRKRIRANPPQPPSPGPSPHRPLPPPGGPRGPQPCHPSHLPAAAPAARPTDGWNCRAGLGSCNVPAAGGHQAAGLIFSAFSI